MKIFSFSICGLGAVEKRREIRRLILEGRLDVFCIQETKLKVVDDVMCRSLWDTSVVDVWMAVNISNSLIVKGKFLKNNNDFSLANVYELSGMLQRHNTVAWCVLGNFNVVRSSEEQRSRSVISSNDDFTPFNHFIDGNFLLDLPLCGRNFTWYGGDGLSMSRLRSFFIIRRLDYFVS